MVKQKPPKRYSKYSHSRLIPKQRALRELLRTFMTRYVGESTAKTALLQFHSTSPVVKNISNTMKGYSDENADRKMVYAVV